MAIASTWPTESMNKQTPSHLKMAKKDKLGGIDIIAIVGTAITSSYLTLPSSVM